MKDILDAITSCKLKYYEGLANKLSDPNTVRKTYWKILKTFINGTKIPLIPLLLVGNQSVLSTLVSTVRRETTTALSQQMQLLQPRKDCLLLKFVQVILQRL